MPRRTTTQRARQQLNRGAVQRAHRRGELLRSLAEATPDAELLPALLHEVALTLTNPKPLPHK